MIRSASAAATAVLLLVTTSPLWAQTPRESEAFGPKGSTLPKGARKIPAEEFEIRLQGNPSLRLIQKDSASRARTRVIQKSQEDRRLVEETLKTRPELVERHLRRLPTTRSPLHTVRLKNGKTKQVTLQGAEASIAELASVIRANQDAGNALKIYQSLLKLAKPETVRKHPRAERLSGRPAIEIQRASRKLYTDVRVDIPVVVGPVLAPYLGCGTETGSGLGLDLGPDNCTPSTDGLVRGATFALKNYLPCVKDQGGRGTCVAFGITSALETAVRKEFGLKKNFSEQKFYYDAKKIWTDSDNYGDGLNTVDALISADTTNFDFPLEVRWDYNPSLSRDENDIAEDYDDSCLGYSSEHCSDTNHQGDVVCADVGFFTYCATDGSVTATSGHQITNSFVISNLFDMEFSALLGSLYVNAGYPLVASLYVTPSFDNPDSNGYVNYVGANEDNRGSHAISIVGYIANENLPAGAPAGDGGGYFIIKNSWGNCFSDGGYIYLPMDWMVNYGKSISVLDNIK